MIITFNTGRLYTHEGQVVTAELVPDAEVIRFQDHSRGISGEVECPTWSQTFTRPGTLAAYVMERYDRGDYQATLAWLARQEPEHQFRL